MSQSEIGAGDVPVTLGEHDLVLRPTLKAATVLSSGRGGITTMTQRCLDLEFDAIQSVIVAGIGGKMSKDLPELVFKAGLIDLSTVCITFLHVLANGGRPLSADDAEEDDSKAPLAAGSQ